MLSDSAKIEGFVKWVCHWRETVGAESRFKSVQYFLVVDINIAKAFLK